MTRFDLEQRQPSHATAVRAGLADSSLAEEKMGLLEPDSRTIAAAFERLWRAQRELTDRNFARGFGSARAGLHGKPAEEEG